jgi:uncharacterized YkwD family protein
MKGKQLLLLFVLFISSFMVGEQVLASERISGESRYHTAVEISKSGWSRADVVVLAKGNDFPDALAGAPLAYEYQAPILLTQENQLHSATEKEIVRLNAKKVIILGGTSAISLVVEEKLKKMGLEVERIGGKSRYDTAALIAKQLSSKKAVVASGANFPDALAVAPYAARNGIPILLTKRASLPNETKTALQGKTSTILVGGTGVIAEGVMNDIPNAVRYSGSDRFGTAHQIITKLALGKEKAYVATGSQFADALAGSVLAAKNNAPIILTNATYVPGSVHQTLSQEQFTSLTLFGGESAINEATRAELQTLSLVDGDMSSVSEEEWEVFVQVNKERHKENLPPLRLHVGLSEVARLKSKDMHDKGYFAHQSPTYGSPTEMMRDYGFSGRASGENVAAGYTSSTSVMDGWMNSEGHRSNILSKSFTHIGVGYHSGDKGYRQYWTQLFYTPNY